jgi:hypothetical protein
LPAAAYRMALDDDVADTTLSVTGLNVEMFFPARVSSPLNCGTASLPSKSMSVMSSVSLAAAGAGGAGRGGTACGGAGGVYALEADPPDAGGDAT